MKVVIASDHAGFHLKEEVKRILTELDVEFEDLGPAGTDSVDYPDYAEKVARQVQNGVRGILCCGTGIGMAMAANKIKGIRAAVCHDVYTARMSREHNDANVLAMGGRILQNPSDISNIVKVWLETEFQGGRHQRRLDKIRQLEE